MNAFDTFSADERETMQTAHAARLLHLKHNTTAALRALGLTESAIVTLLLRCNTIAGILTDYQQARQQIETEVYAPVMARQRAIDRGEYAAREGH